MKYLAVVAACLLVSCGGGGSGSGNTTAPVYPTSRPGIHYGSFGDDCHGTAAAFSDIRMIAGWCWDGATFVTPVDEAIQAKRAGQKIVLLPVNWIEADLRQQLTDFRNANVLDAVIAIYPQDEPDVALMTDTEVKGLCDMTRRVAAEFVELQHVELWAIYGTQGNDGRQYFDKTGTDNYGHGPQGGEILVPGGAAPWREDPEGYVAAALADTRVAVVMPFIWHWPDRPGDSIEGSYIEPKYVAAGHTLTGK